MRLTRYFLTVLKQMPKEAEIISHRLMLRAGMIQQEASGIYAWLPIGLRVLRKVQGIIEQEQNRAGAIELLMPTLQSADLWRESGRYDDYGSEMLRIQDRHERDLLYGPTNEEMITDIFRTHVKSYKNLPLNLYHVQWKFRDEIRPRFGTMRSREFLMKDAYSFDLDKEGAVKSYHRMFVAYLRTFKRMGLTAIPMRAETGPIGGDLSHEFIILADTGESGVYCDRALLDCKVPGSDIDFDGDLTPIINDWTSCYAATEDMIEMDRFESEVPSERRIAARGIEVGQVFYFGTKYSRPLGATVTSANGQETPVHMGSYGIGLTRVLPAIIEACHDDSGIVWPVSVAPFELGLVNIKVGDTACVAACEDLYVSLKNAGIDVLYDDRDVSAGGKFATMDLIGLPYQMLVGPRGIQNGEVEIKNRKSGERTTIPMDTAVEYIRSVVEPLRMDQI